MHGLRYKVSQSCLASVSYAQFFFHYSKGDFSKEHSPLYLVTALPPWRQRADATKHHLLKWTQQSESGALDYADDLELAGLEADSLLSEEQYKAKPRKKKNKAIKDRMHRLRYRLYTKVQPILLNLGKRCRFAAWALLVMYLSA